MGDLTPFPFERAAWAAALTEEHRFAMRDELVALAGNEAATARALDRWRALALRDAARRRIAALRRAG